MACGDKSELAILFVAMLVLAYSLGVVLPMLYLSIKVGRLARGAGGCADFEDGAPLYVVVQGRQPSCAAVGVPIGSGVPVASASVPQARPISSNGSSLPGRST